MVIEEKPKNKFFIIACSILAGVSLIMLCAILVLGNLVFKKETKSPTAANQTKIFSTVTLPVRAATARPQWPTQPYFSPTPCDCKRDYNCDDFHSPFAAQACFDLCGGGDWSNLDRDSDGRVCE